MTATLDVRLTRREVAEILGVGVNTIDVHRRRTKAGRGTFPEPAGYFGNRPWWTPEQIAEYQRTRAPGGWHGQMRNRQQ